MEEELRDESSLVFSTSLMYENLFKLALRNDDIALLRLCMKYSNNSCVNRRQSKNVPLFAFGNIISPSPLHQAIQECNYPFLEILLEAGADVNVTCTLAQPNLSFNATCMCSSLFLAVFHNRGCKMFDFLNCLLEHGAKVDQYIEWLELDETDTESQYTHLEEGLGRAYRYYKGTLLHYASRHMMPELANFLLIVGANPILPMYQQRKNTDSDKDTKHLVPFSYDLEAISINILSSNFFKYLSKKLKDIFFSLQLCLNRIVPEMPEEVRHIIMHVIAHDYYQQFQPDEKSSMDLDVNDSNLQAIHQLI